MFTTIIIKKGRFWKHKDSCSSSHLISWSTLARILQARIDQRYIAVLGGCHWRLWFYCIAVERFQCALNTLRCAVCYISKVLAPDNTVEWLQNSALLETTAKAKRIWQIPNISIRKHQPHFYRHHHPFERNCRTYPPIFFRVGKNGRLNEIYFPMEVLGAEYPSPQ